jgi:mono/diheme cytochrome c family protein
LEYVKKLVTTPFREPSPGEKIYEMACLTCHQPEGKGLGTVYPSLAASDWVRGDKARLIKIVLHGLTGPVDVAGQKFGVGPNPIPMPAMGGLTDAQISDVLTFVRDSYGGKASPVTPDEVKSVRDAHGDRTVPWTAPELDK